MKTFILLFLVSTAAFSQISDEQRECANAVLAEMKARKLISNSGQDICIQTLSQLPQLDIGVGSAAYDRGQSGKGLSDKDVGNLNEISEILTGGPLKNYKILGYADGSVNNDVDYEKDFFESGAKTFTKSQVLSKLASDPSTSEIVKSLLADKKDDELIEASKVPKVMSLVRNFYLGKDRAMKTCQQFGKTPEECNKMTQGYASPFSELAGNLACNQRRRSVLSLNSQIQPPSSQAKNGAIIPRFKTPALAEDRRDMQLASGLDLFKKLNMAQTVDGKPFNPDEFDKYIEAVIPKECSSKDAGKNTRDNFKRLLKHVQKLASELPASQADLKSAIFKGDYKKIKIKLNALLEAEDTRALTEEEKAQYRLMSTVITGYDAKLEQEGKKFISVDKTTGKVNPIAIKEFPEGCLNKYNVKVKCGSFQGHIYLQDQGDKLLLENNRSDIVYKNGVVQIPETKQVNWTTTDTLFADPQFPYSSNPGNSVDHFNCLSASSAIEEKLSQNNSQGGAGSLIDPSLVVKDDTGNVDIKLPESLIPTLPDGTKGWVCEYCHSGTRYEKIRDTDKKGTVYYDSRDNTSTGRSAYVNKEAQVNSKALTMGSMKSLAIFSISRDSFGGECPPSKSTCECMKNAGSYDGGIDKIISNSATQKIVLPTSPDQQTGVMKKQTTVLKPTNDTCFYVPPVPHSCMVNPRGESRDRMNQGVASKSCVALDNLIKKYNLAQGKDLAQVRSGLMSKYKNVKSSELTCKSVFPSSDEANDCPGIATKIKKAKADFSSANEQ
ncbi:MAG: hypothetical protein H0V66_15175 [Bdellovibrionales bacterium]|nr:hypothetical protein [Bdellovibrionales bacterium]